MSGPASQRLLDSRGPVALGPEVGRGGEGAVFEIIGHPGRVAKVYHKPLSADRASKIEAMASMTNEGLLRLMAWPVDLLKTSAGVPCGLVMERVSGHKDIHSLYSPKSRKLEFPEADWRFLTRTALNVSKAFGAIHGSGCVIGDVNHGGVAVSDKAEVKLIDCDSFQVVARGRQFLCEVGVPLFTPPELQGRSLSGIVRSPNHDNFGLAVLIFHLLLMGRHPFAGRYSGHGEMPIEKAIEEYRFAYGANRSGYQIEPPPNTPPLMAVSEPVAALFERAFSRECAAAGNRPTARQWIEALVGLEAQMAPCRTNLAHTHFRGVSECPWCRVETATGAVLFNVSARMVQQQADSAASDFNRICAEIGAVQHLPDNPHLRAGVGSLPKIGPRRPVTQLRASDAAVAAGGRRRATQGKAFAGVSGVVGMLSLAVPTYAGLWMLGGLAALGGVVSGKDLPEVAAIRQAHQAASTASTNAEDGLMWAMAALARAEKGYLAAIAQLRGATASEQRFHETLTGLKTLRDRWNGIPGIKARQLAILGQEREREQRRQYLETFYVDRSTIPGIGPGRQAMLNAYNIETAWDVTEQGVMQVPGFGPSLTGNLVAWRQVIEQGFRFDSSRGVDPRELAKLERKMDEERGTILQSIRVGQAQLAQLRQQIISHRGLLQEQAEAARQQAEAARQQALSAQARADVAFALRQQAAADLKAALA